MRGLADKGEGKAEFITNPNGMHEKGKKWRENLLPIYTYSDATNNQSFKTCTHGGTFFKFEFIVIFSS